MSPLRNSPDLPPTRASVRGKGTGRKQKKKVPDKTADVSLTEAADSGTTQNPGQALNHEHVQMEETKKKNMVRKRVCSCSEHERDPRYYVFPTEGQVDIPSCANKCPYCESSVRKGGHAGAIIRKHIKNTHCTKRGDVPADFPNLNVKNGTKGRAGRRRMTPLVSLDDIDTGNNGEALG